MLAPGDLIRILAPTVGYPKYHLCLEGVLPQSAARFLFLNSDPGYQGTYDVPCARVPCLPPSQTGFTCFSFNMMPRFNARQLELYQATKMGVLDRVLAGELETFALVPSNIEGLNSPERTLVRQVLALLK